MSRRRWASARGWARWFARSALAALPLLFGCDGDLGGAPQVDGGGEETALDALLDASDASDDALGDAQDDGARPEFIVQDLTVTTNPANTLSVYVGWRSNRLVATELVLRCPGEVPVRYGPGTEATLDHEVYVAGLWSGAECEVEVPGASWGGTARFETERPGVFLPSLEVPERAEEALAPGWTLLNLNNDLAEGLPARVAVVDERGRYRWYHTHWESRGADVSTEVTPEGVLVGGFFSERPSLVSWEGAVLWTGPFVSHHELLWADEGQTFWYLGNTGSCPPELSEDGSGYLRGSSVNRWDRAAGRATFNWAICDHFVPDEVWDDWAHLNAIAPWGDDRLLLSSRNQSLLLLVDVPSGDVVWTLGEGGDFALVETAGAPDPRFWSQHAPELVAGEGGASHILLFDNGVGRGWSRALELAYDEEGREARAVWEFRDDPDLFSPVYGDVDRLGNGNTLVTFGSSLEAARAQVIEVDAEGEVVWRLRLAAGWSTYRAERFEDLPRGWVTR